MFNSGFRGKRAKDNTGTVAAQTQFVQQQEPQPSISGYTIVGTDDTALNPAGGQTVLVNGTGFASGAAVTVNGITISPVTVISPTQLSFTSTALSGGSYSLIVYNSTGGAAILVPGLIYSAVPTWTTSAGSIGSFYETTAITANVVATSDSAITYSLSSGSLPTGATLYANGVITGTSPIESGSTTYTFAIKAEDQELQDTTRTFTLTINTDVVTWNSPANATIYTSSVDTAISNVVMSATSAAGYGITYSANTLPTGLSISGANITGTPNVIANTTTLLTATASTTNRSATRTINWVVQLGNDPYFNYTTLLLNGETSSTYWIQDTSSNSFALTVNGDTKPVAFSPYETVWSGQFDGTNDYISTPANSAFSFGTGDFTIECFIKTTDNSLAPGGYSRSIMYIGDFDFYLRIPAYHGGTDGALRVSGLSDGSTVSLKDGVWHHIAIVRESNIIRLWIDGIYQTAGSGTTYSTNHTNVDTNVVGGRANPIAGYFNGNISNVRVVKGTAVYTGTNNFRVPISPLTAIAGTSFLTCANNRFVDASTNALAITVNDAPVISNFAPLIETDLVTGSAYFDGTGDYLTVPNSGTFNFSAPSENTNDFCIEFWIYQANTNITSPVCTAYSAGINSYWMIGTNRRGSDGANVAGYLNFYLTDSFYIETTSGFSPNIWNHIVACRTGTTVSLFLNGIRVATNTTSINPNSSGLLQIGGEASQLGRYLTGYISNLRIVKGSTQPYSAGSSSITVPPNPLTTITNTSLLTLQSRIGESNNRFVDISGFNSVITRNGNVTQGTFSPFSQTGWSGSFNGSNDPVSLASTTALNIESVDFTIEAWIYMNVMPTGTSTSSWSGDWSQWFIIYERSAGGTTGWQFRVGATLLTLGGDGDSSIAWGIHGMTTNTWYHVAVSRASSTYRIFVNGTPLTLTTQAVNMATSGTYYIGSEDTGGANFNGYISNLRVIKGQAIYTGSFTPSTTPLTPVTIGSTGAGVSASLTGAVVLLTCNSSVWVDNSGAANTITRSGVNTRVVSFSPFAPAIITPTSYSGYFDGTGDYLTAPAGSSVSGTGVFTVEFWIYSPAIASGYRVLTAAASGGFAMTLNSTGTIGYGRALIATDGTTTGAINFNQWNHVAAVRNGTGAGQFVIYINGASAGSFTNTTNYTSGTVYIGIDGNGTDFAFTGNISNYRIVNGSAVYTSTFTPPTSPLTAITNTSLLTCQSNRFIDNSTNNFTVTVNGNAVIRQFNPFGNNLVTGRDASYSLTYIGGSMYFDGNSDYLAIANNTDAFNCGTSNFTMEFWYYDDGNSLAYPSIISSTDWATDTGGVGLRYNNTGQANKFSFFWYGVGDPWLTTPGTFPGRQWNHVALTRSGNTFTLWVNGVSQASNTNAGTINWGLTSGGPKVGGGNWDGANSYTKGYISNLRLLKGVALYTSGFNPPVSPLTPIANTTLLLGGTNSGIIDYTGKTDLETVGNAQLSTTVKKFGSASMYFDGTGDYLNTNNTTNCTFGSGNFTIELWINPSQSVNEYMMVDFRAANGAFPMIGHDSTRGVFYYLNTGYAIASNTVLASGTWYHVAVARSGSSTKLFVNGTQVGSTFTDSTNLGVGTNRPVIGINGTTLNNLALTGYIDDLRITKGIARYTSNFTAPTQAFITF